VRAEESAINLPPSDAGIPHEDFTSRTGRKFFVCVRLRKQLEDGKHEISLCESVVVTPPYYDDEDCLHLDTSLDCPWEGLRIPRERIDYWYVRTTSIGKKLT
jgi:hypothetical protein